MFGKKLSLCAYIFNRNCVVWLKVIALVHRICVVCACKESLRRGTCRGRGPVHMALLMGERHAVTEWPGKQGHPQRLGRDREVPGAAASCLQGRATPETPCSRTFSSTAVTGLLLKLFKYCRIRSNIVGASAAKTTDGCYSNRIADLRSNLDINVCMSA